MNYPPRRKQAAMLRLGDPAGRRIKDVPPSNTKAHGLRWPSWPPASVWFQQQRNTA